MEESRTLVLMATMRSPTIGSPDQTQKRAHCAKKHRPRRATAPDFPACAGVPEAGTRQLKQSPQLTAMNAQELVQVEVASLSQVGPAKPSID